MDKGELNLYRDTFEAGRRAGMEALAWRIKEKLGNVDMLVTTNDTKKMIDKF